MISQRRALLVDHQQNQLYIHVLLVNVFIYDRLKLCAAVGLGKRDFKSKWDILCVKLQLLQKQQILETT